MPADVEAQVATARAQAAEAGLATQTAQLRELQGALAIAGEEFEEAEAAQQAAEEEVALLRAILAEKDAQLRALEELAGSALEESSKRDKS
jgi:thiamine monophosphate synthase